MTERLYLDYAATTPVRAEVLEAMMPFFSQTAHNAASVHAEGRAARAALDQARERIAARLGAKPKEIIFTAGGSEADNLAIIGAARAQARRHLVSDVVEHHAVLHALDALGSEGFSISLCGVDADGLVNAQAFSALLSDDTALCSVMLVNNELGTVQPVAELSALAHERGALFHTDAVQAAAYLPLDMKALGVDLLSMAAHKFYGPKGVGALFVREGTALIPLVHGGSQEFAKRAGTENVAGIVGMARALDLAAQERDASAARLAALRDEFEGAVLGRIADVRVNGGAAPRSPHISNLSFLGVESEQLLMRLDLDGIAVSAGSACASGAIEPSHVIAALGLPPAWMKGVLRFSFGRETAAPDAARAVGILERAVAEVRAVSACF